MENRTHKCAVPHCERLVPLKMLMCFSHWKKVPKHLQSDIWRTYRPGQENDLSKLTCEYRFAMQAAIKAVVDKERGEHAEA